ncbi:hypothetical protein LAZ67_3006262 [Cordylochernes scorpioides]|uniref:Retrovirus-related Pol polyprotein from transposon TNT 1-94 n=1 Tax=Cordylochernes scorpioides TaxID=51811 RepID=A0ABY6KCD0_9ARAC|nr:hypothetical protein LAZ67_3006262 [Cordylochernes scorpioides]
MPGHRKRRQFRQTDAFTRGMVIGLKRAGWSMRQIAADTHLGASTVHRLWRRWLEQGNVAIYRNVGATRVTSARVDRRILRQAVEAPQATCTAILQHVQDTLDHSISTRTISRRLVANGLHSCRPLRRLPLTPPNTRQRLEWCRARSTWMTEWHRVVFSDESRFCLSSDSRRVRVWRRRGERSNPAAIVERPTVRQRGIMVWGAIAYDSRSPLLRIQGTMTAQRYVDDVLRPDNARPHTARISQQALQDVQMLPWPPYSPDLSPIEHVWDIIGRRLHALPQPRSEDELWQMVEREWRAIPQEAIHTLIDSLPRRVAACIAVRVTTLSDEQAGMFLDETKAKKVWDELKKIYTGNLEDKIIDIGLELKNIKMKNNESINEYMARAKNIASQSSSLGHQISQRELAFHVVRGIHPRLEKIAVVLRTRRELTLDEIRQSLREEANRMNSKMNGSHSDENEQAYRSKDRRNHYQQNRQKECFVCHKKGHLAKDCWFKNKRTQEQHGRRNANSNTNYNKQNFRNNANTVSSKPAEQTMLRTCTRRCTYVFPRDAAERDLACTGEWVVVLNSVWMDIKPQTFNTSSDRVFENSSNNYSQIQTWCLDSGCTTHLSPHLDWMENVMPYGSEINLAEEGKVTHATVKGDIKVSTCTENGIENVQIKGVLHVPNLRYNLLSIYELTNKGNTVIFIRDGAKIYNEQDDLIAEAQIQDRMYVMETRSRDEYSEKTENVMTTKDDFSIDNISLWHRRLNHLNEAYMKEIIQRNVVLGFRRTFIYLLKNKDETLGKFEEFKARVENELNLKIKDVRTDNGTEFTNHRFKNFLIKNGIHYQLSTTYSPQSNGVAERVNRTLIETARTLLFDSGLPMAFWAEAVATASYVKNCTPHRSIKLDTPMEKWKGRKPSFQHFRIFGCLAFWPITQQHRSKFMPKSRKGIFVGYSLKRKAYRVYDIITKKIEEVRSVKFVENEKGINYAKNLQEDTNYDHFSYKKEEEDDIEIDHRTCPETSELNEETIPTLGEPNEERIVRSGRKKGDTQEVLEEKHRAKLREEEMKLLEQGEWLEAIKEELYYINKHKVWTLVQREKNMKIINCKWIFSIKSTPSEGVYRRKARLVAIGYNQKYGVEYEESFSPVIRKESLRAIVALAAQLNLVITSYDVKTAYLNGELKETIFMKQPEGFVEKEIALEECNIVQTPGDRDQSFNECQDSKPVDRTLYQEMIGSLMYLATGTRPDISFNVSNLSRFCNDAREVHLTGVKRIYRYLKGTRDKMLRYKPSENSILVSTDASWCSTSDAKSYSGYRVKLGNNLISWRSKKQSLVALSTCEAELISICEWMCEVKWIKGLLEELCKDANFPTQRLKQIVNLLSSGLNLKK